MIAQVLPNIYSIPVPLPNNPLKNLNAYLVKGETRSLLIDTGFRQEPCRKALLAGLEELGVSMENTDIFLTHLHSDHTGLAPELVVPGTRIFISSVDLKYLPGPFEGFSWQQSDDQFLAHGFPADLLRQVAEENPAKAFAPPAYDRYLPVGEGDTFQYGGYSLEAIFTPGHTPGHMCLYDREQELLFLGDHVLFDITPNITCWSDTKNALGLYKKSLEKLLSLPVRLPLPAHRTVHQDLHSRIREILAHHERRCGEVLTILKDSPDLTAYEITAGMTWQIRCRSWEDFPLAQKWFAVGEAIAHLEDLEERGLVASREENGVVLYRVV